MQTEVKIDFHGAKRSGAIEQVIADHVAKLEHVYGGITACHVGLKVRSEHHRKSGPYEVSVHMVLPNGREVNVRRTPHLDERYSNVLFAVNDAFRRARRQLQDHVRRLQASTKAHEPQPIGTVATFNSKTGFGFIRSERGDEIYFHKNSVVGAPLRKITLGTRVTFAEEAGEKGPQASTVRVLGKHALR